MCSHSLAPDPAEAHGVKLGFFEYARVGVSVTLLTVVWGTTVLLLD